MSQPTPPSPQPSDPSQQQPLGQPQPQGQPQPGAFGFPAAPVAAPAPPPRPTNFAGGVLAAFAVTVVCSILYGVIASTTNHQIGYAAVGLGFLVGLTASRLGGRSVWLFAWAAVFSMAGMYFGQLLDVAMYIAKHTDESVTDLFTAHFGLLTDAWSEALSPVRFLFIGLGVVGAYSGAKKANG
jgi:hypothetical protein